MRMTNQEILEKAIQKAVDGGWKGSPYLEYDKMYEKMTGEKWTTDMVMGDGVWLVTIVYSPPHDFAKALWPGEQYPNQHVYQADVIESPEDGAAGYTEYHTLWEYHLREMVIAENPLDYLKENM